MNFVEKVMPHILTALNARWRWFLDEIYCIEVNEGLAFMQGNCVSPAGPHRLSSVTLQSMLILIIKRHNGGILTLLYASFLIALGSYSMQSDEPGLSGQLVIIGWLLNVHFGCLLRPGFLFKDLWLNSDVLIRARSTLLVKFEMFE